MGLFDEFAKQVANAAQTLAEGNGPRLAQGFLEMLQDRGGLDGLDPALPGAGSRAT